MDHVHSWVDYLGSHKSVAVPLAGIGVLWALGKVYSALSTPKWSFKDKIVVITGASSGIGQACALEATRRGASGLVITARTESLLQQTAASCETINPECKITIVLADISIKEQCQLIVDRAIEAFGRIDCLMLCAGIGMGDRMEDVTNVDLYETLMKVNYFQNVWIVYYALKHLIASKGRINSVSSGMGKIAFPLRTGFCGSKFALDGFYQSLRAETLEYGIKITLTVPGAVSTNAESRRLGPDGKPGTSTHKVDLSSAMPPARCANIMLDATERGQIECFPIAPIYNVLHGIQYFFPSLMPRVAHKVGMRMNTSADTKK